MKALRLILLLLVGAMCARAQITTIQDTLYTANGTKFNGTMIIQWPVPFVGGDSRQIAAGPPWITYNITNGVVNVQLEANTTASPAGTYYTVTLRPGGVGSLSQTWVVPYSATPINLSAVQSTLTPTPSFTVALVQLAQDAATNNQCVIWSTSAVSWQPGACASGSLSSISAVNGGVVFGANNVLSQDTGFFNYTDTAGAINLFLKEGPSQGTLGPFYLYNNAGGDIAHLHYDGGWYAGYYATGNSSTAPTGILLAHNTINFGSGSVFQFSSTANYFGTPDLGFTRNAAGVMEIDTGTAGTYRDLILRNIDITGVCTGCGGGSPGGVTTDVQCNVASALNACATTVFKSDSSGNVSANSITLTSLDSGSTYMKGLTSGGVQLAVDDIAGTAITYVMPSTNGTSGQVLTDNGSITCPTLAAGSPATCHQLVWTTPGGVTPPATTITTSTFTFSGSQGYYFNENATAGQAVTGTLPTAAAGLQYCLFNGYNGSAANTGALSVQTSASGQYIIFSDSTLTASGGYVASAGAGGDEICVVGIDTTHWMMAAVRGSIVKH